MSEQNEAGDVFNLKYSDTISSLSKAVQGNDPLLVRKLLQKGLLPQSPDNRGWCSIHYCIQCNNLEALKLILNYRKKSRKYLSNLQNWMGETPLIMAVKKDLINLDIIKTLLESGADPNIYDNEGKTALHIACSFKGNISLIKLLFDHGADVNKWDFYHGCLPLHISLSMACDEDMSNFLVDKTDLTVTTSGGMTALTMACVFDCTETVKHILQKDTKTVNMIWDRRRISPLSAAVENGNLELVKLLLLANADTEAIVSCKCSCYTESVIEALPIYSSFCHPNIFKELLNVTRPDALLSVGAKSMEDNLSSLAIYTLLYSTNSESFEILLQHQSPPDCEILKHVDASLLFDILMHNPPCCKINSLTQFKKFFKYCSHLEPEHVFQVFANRTSSHETLLKIYEYFGILAKMGISSAVAYDCKCKVISFLYDCLRENGEEKSRRNELHEIIIHLQHPVLTLKEISRVAFRRYVRSLAKTEWDAYVMIRDSSLPNKVKEFVWYQ